MPLLRPGFESLPLWHSSLATSSLDCHGSSTYRKNNPQQLSKWTEIEQKRRIRKVVDLLLLEGQFAWDFDRTKLWCQAFQKIIIWNCSLKFMNSPDTNVHTPIWIQSNPPLPRPFLFGLCCSIRAINGGRGTVERSSHHNEVSLTSPLCYANGGAKSPPVHSLTGWWIHKST